MNNVSNRGHERCLRIIYNGKYSTFRQLLVKDNSVTIHKRDLRSLATEMFEVTNDISPLLLNELFHGNEENNQNLRHPPCLSLPIVKKVFSKLKDLSYLGPKIWEIVQSEI